MPQSSMALTKDTKIRRKGKLKIVDMVTTLTLPSEIKSLTHISCNLAVTHKEEKNTSC